MSLSDSRLDAALQAAISRIKFTVAEAAERALVNIAERATHAESNRHREHYVGAQYQLRRRMPAFHAEFAGALRDEVAKDMEPRRRSTFGPTHWQALSLVDDKQVEALVTSDRLGQTIAQDCEWELRELDGFMGSLLRIGRADKERNPLRPDVLGKALLRGTEMAVEDADSARVISMEIARTLAKAMPNCYTSIIADLHARGVEPTGMSVRTVEGPGTDFVRSGFDSRRGPSSSFEETLGLPGENQPYLYGAEAGGHMHGPGGYGAAPAGYFPGHGVPGTGEQGADDHDGRQGYQREAEHQGQPGTGLPGSVAEAGSYSSYSAARGAGAAHPAGGGGSAPHARAGTASSGHSRLSSRHGHVGGAPARGTPIGAVDAQMMTLLRRLAYLGPIESALDSAVGPVTGGLATGGSATGALFSGPGGGSGFSSQFNTPIAANLIRAHRDELRQAATGTLDHMVIDVVGSLFDQILSDPKVPPQMARQIARLQLPVLRVALGDVTFFSSRRHPVRRFVNRIASLSCAFDDFDEDPGKRFLERVRALVQEIVRGDFDQMELYEAQLAELEAFIAEEAENDVTRQGDTAELLAVKEDELRLQQRYLQQLSFALRAVNLPAFLHDFLTQVWSQTIVHVSRKAGADSDLAKRMKRAARDLVMSIQPKGAPAQRKKFLIGLPQLMKDLNEGLAAIGWPDEAKKAFFGQLLPAHAESLKAGTMSELDHNMLVRQLDAIFGAPLPRPEELHRSDFVPVLDDVVHAPLFSPEEAAKIGLVEESRVNWDGVVDIEVGAEPELTEVDINIDGLPAPEPPEPTKGPQLVDHIQLGFAYQMHLADKWQKVRLSHVSPGRAFFVFTYGSQHQKTISMTSRMVKRMCDTGRFRAFENAYLIERATARARKQLAALTASSRH